MIKSTGAERIPRKKQKLRMLNMKSVSFGWKVLDKHSGKYKYVLAGKGSGARNVHFNSNSTASDIITEMTESFYPNVNQGLAGKPSLVYVLAISEDR